MKLTDKQREAVFTRGEDIIISAAAGSGKTTVLAERVLGLVREGADIRRMLICTYTRPAAAELRRRIYDKLAGAADELKDARLRRQADCVAAALIGTIHSFCTQVINDNFLRAGLKMSWRTGSSALCDKLKRTAVDEAFDELYEEDDEDMLWLAARYGGRSDRALAEQLLRLYELSRSLPEGIDGLKKDKAQYQRLIADSTDRFIKGELGLMADLAKKCLDTAMIYDGFEKEYANAEDICRMVEELCEAYEREGVHELRRMLEAFSLPRLKPRLQPKEAVDYYKSCKEGIKDSAAQMASLLDTGGFDIDAEAEYMSRMGSAFNTLLTRFCAHYQREKAERGVLDYDDLIHTAYALLKQEDIAAQYREKLDYVFIDEFQDTNEIQDALLECVCGDNVRFIVGDVKQSIYSFRLADPKVFVKKTGSIERSGRVIYMNDNFRSSPVIIDEINRIMGELMSPQLGGVSYTDGERLAAGRDTAGGVDMLCAVNADDPYGAEAELIADKITELLEEGYAYGDIAVLLRKKARAEVIKQALERRGIPAFFDGATGSPPEIDLFVEHLRLIDSENDDRALIAVMRSPAVGFDEEELARIRCASPEGSFAEAVRGYEKDDALGGKTAAFLAELDRLRLLAHAMPTEDFLIELKKFTRFDEILPALPAGQMRHDSFSRFFDSLLGYAKEGGLYALICTLEQIKERNGGSYAEAADTAVPDNCVNIMTIHKSKGLQFKVVIAAQLNDRFNLQDAQATLLTDRRWGAVSDIFDADKLRRYPSRSRILLADEKIHDELSEQLRVLYVALTRAEERLILTCGVKKESTFSYVPAGKARSFMGWLYPLFEGRIKYVYPAKVEAKQEEAVMTDALIEKAKLCPPARILSPSFVQIPVKLGVSSLLSPYESDGGADTPMQAQYAETDAPPREKNCGTDFGTLVHAFLQHYDYAARPTVREQLERLKERSLMDEADARQLLSFERELERFIHSPVADRIAAADEVLRELPFSIGVRAEELGYASQDIVVIQGIMDLVLREGSEYTIIDYKTNLSRDFDKLKEHYAPQLGFYRRALEECRGARVRECLLCFIRSGVVKTV